MSSIFICGDIMNLSNSTRFIGDSITKVIEGADYAIANLEGPELCGTYRFPHQTEGTIQYLYEVGFDLMLLANNHITELGTEGIRNTISRIERTGMDYIGAGLSWTDAYRPIIRDISGYKFGFINVCEAQVGHYFSPKQPYGYAWMGYDGLFNDVRTLSKEVDYVIIFVHAGLEHYNLPLPEFKVFYHRLCDAGATAVIGGHPHIAQGYEFYGYKLIDYSLGNFFFPRAAGIYENENTSYSLMLTFDGRERIGVNIIHHSLKNGVVDVENDINKQIDIEYLNQIISKDYERNAEEMCVKAYYSICEKLLAEALCGETTDIKRRELLKNIIKRSLFRKRFIYDTKINRQKLLLRLYENETYRFTITRALKSITK